MFKQMKNIDTAFNHIRSFCIAFLIFSALVDGIILYQSHRSVEQARASIWVLAGDKVLEAYISDRKDNIPVEARDHIRTFLYDFFTLDPDEKVVESHLTRALYLADASAKKQYDNLRESGYYHSLIAANISQQLEIEDLTVDTRNYPYYFHCVAKERLIRSTSILTRSLITEGYCRNVARSDNNPHGFLIERWTIIENKDVKTETR